MSLPIRIIIADDHNIMLQGLKSLFSEDIEFEVCTTVNSCEAAITALKDYKPQLLITDITFQDGDGIELFKKSMIFHPELKALCLTMHKEQGYVSKAFQAGIHGYLPKESHIKKIKDVSKLIMSGKRHFENELFNYIDDGQSKNGMHKEKLSFRELEIIQLISEGFSSKEIADKICLSYYTVDTHRKNINTKLNVKNVGELLKVAYENKIIV